MPITTLVADTGVVYAALDPEESDHGRCADLLSAGGTITIPAPVITELDWLGRRRGKPTAGSLLLESVLDGSVLVYDLDQEDWSRVRDLMHRYADLPLPLVDASVVAVAERLEQQAIATLDRRHFSVVKPRHVRSFQLLPD